MLPHILMVSSKVGSKHSNSNNVEISRSKMSTRLMSDLISYSLVRPLRVHYLSSSILIYKYSLSHFLT